VLLVGDFPGLVRGHYPGVVEAEARGLALAECVYGVGWRLDLLPVVSAAAADALDKLGGRRLTEGRYEFILQSSLDTADAPSPP
jgi:hypothetical protein